MLVRLGAEPITAASGREALDLLEASAAKGDTFPLVLLDAMMPEMDGFTLAERIKSQTNLYGATLMMLSSGDHHQDVQRCRALGVAQYLTKPVTHQELVRSITRLLLCRLQASGSEAHESPAAAAQSTVRPLRILLAEDNVVNQKLAARVLESRGHQVVVVGTGIAALSALGQQTFDLVLMDVQMPEMGGLEATAAIREREQLTGGHIPIVALTAHAMKGDREMCIAAGMDDYLAKPIQAQALMAVIENLLPTTRIAGETSTAAAQPAPSISSDQLPAVSPSVLIDHFEGDGELLRDIIDLYFEQRIEMIYKAESALAAGDSTTLERVAHSLRGMLSNLCAHTAVEQALELELLARDKQLTQAAAKFAQLQVELEAVGEALRGIAADVAA
jgi:CheY-like chemotaxis protein/HPt (histidine-containing phosphotransfer) domain-containing protein